MRKRANCIESDAAKMLNLLEAHPDDDNGEYFLDNAKATLRGETTGYDSFVYKWLAFVTKGNVIKAVFCEDASSMDSTRYVATIGMVEATKNHPVRGAVSWGFSMLLHRLKFQGIKEVKLADKSESIFAHPDLKRAQLVEEVGKAKAELDTLQGPGRTKDESVEIERLQEHVKNLALQMKRIPTLGSRVYDTTAKPNRPYTYTSVRDYEADKWALWYSYDLSTEGFGSEYGQDEPC